MIRLSKFSNLLATFFGVGIIPWILAPGTFVSLLSIIPWYVLDRLFDWKVLLCLLIFIVGCGCYVCHQTNKDIGIHDHQCIVLDEFIGMWFVLILSPKIDSHNLLLVFFGFIFFRLFDIYKPWPISFIDKHIKNGFGIIFDDITAAIFSIFSLCCLKIICCDNFNIFMLI